MKTKDIGNASYLNKQLKLRGLQKLRFYCQICRKQCRDENGFKSHSRSPYHQKRLAETTEQDLDEYSTLFTKNFLRLLRLSHGEKKIEANKFYNEYIQDKEHIHMNATRFTSLTNFLQHLSREGMIKVHNPENTAEEIDTGSLLISYIDNSSNKIIRNNQMQAYEESLKNEDDVKSKLLEIQIARSRSIESETEDRRPKDTCSDEPMFVKDINISLSKGTKRKSKKSLHNIFKSKK